MKSSTIRLIVFLALLSASGIILTQAYWVRKAYRLGELEFKINTNAALREASENIGKLKKVQNSSYSPVEAMGDDFFMVRTNVYVEKSLLQHYLATALTRENIVTDFNYALYDCSSDTVLYQGYYNMPGSLEKPLVEFLFPKESKENYYFAVQFPYHKEYLSSKMSFFTASTIALICVLIMLCWLVWIVFRQKRLAEVQKSFVNNMTHEFKTPLSTIQLSADVLKDPNIVNSPQRLLNYATIIADESSHLSQQIERVLLMAQAEKKHLQLNKEEFVWQDLLNGVVKKYQEFLEQKGGIVHMHVPENPIKFNGDLLHWKNVVGNLLDNAIKYCAKAPIIDIYLRQDAAGTIIEFHDNGVGIEPAHQNLLFEKFYRVPTGDVHDVKGFGLGLSYVRLITNAHGCNVKIVSNPGKGSIFTVTCP